MPLSVDLELQEAETRIQGVTLKLPPAKLSLLEEPGTRPAFKPQVGYCELRNMNKHLRTLFSRTIITVAANTSSALNRCHDLSH